jgi:hypothetical protein
VCTASVVLSLALAGPAVAADELPISPPAPEPVLPAVFEPESAPDPEPAQPEAELPAPTLSDLSLEDAPATVTITQTAEGDLDVSVRVLSPGEDAQGEPAEADSSVISAASVGDIADAATGDSDPSTGAGELNGVPANTNVSVRVLSPGNNGEAGEGEEPTAAGGKEADGTEPAEDLEDATAPGDRAQEAVAGEGEPVDDPAQYQEQDLQYQSDSISDVDPWTWGWKLTLDCTGNVTSMSDESGTYASSEWSWDWVWNWGCDDAESSGTSGTTGARDPPARSGEDAPELSASRTDEGASPAATQSETSEGIWVWTWTFTFCGNTTSVSTQLPGSTLLSWAWDWAWSWTCAAGSDEPALPADDPPAPALPLPLPLPEPGSGSPSTPPPPVASTSSVPAVFPVLPSLPALPSLPFGPLDVTVVVGLPTGTAASTLPVVTVVVPSVAPSSPVQSVAVPGTKHGPAAPARESTAAVGRRVISPPPAAAPTYSSRQAAPSSHGERREPREAPSARPAPPRSQDEPPSPLKLPAVLGVGGSSSASSGTAPGSIVVLLAVPTGFFVLAAPGIGRRIRPARELSPRSRSASPIDHPG